MTEMSSKELLASVAHSDLKHGEAVIKLGEQWVVCSISDLEVRATSGELTVVEFTGYVKT